MNRLTDSIALADRYWRLCTALAATHSLGLSWQPSSHPQRSKAVGHWGCNPGIAWAVGNLLPNCPEEDGILLVIGTGHATSFAFGHEAIRDRNEASEISETSLKYGQRNGTPSETIGLRDVPFMGGELGPAIAVGQAIATWSGRFVVTVIGDGEFETPVTLAGLAHSQVMHRRADSRWLPIVNANGARMGAKSQFSADDIAAIMTSFGFRVIYSDSNPHSAAEAATEAFRAADRGARVAWISVADKGWPAPPLRGKDRRGSAAHKLSNLDLDNPQIQIEIADWLDELTEGLLDPDGKPQHDITEIARKATFRIATQKRETPLMDNTATGKKHRVEDCLSPIEEADRILANRGTLVFSPDEAHSNRMDACLGGLDTVEVVAEEVCSAWAWGSIEVGWEAVVASYEAFSPLFASHIAQYSKMQSARPKSGRPPMVILLSSLGWANSPTHQNGDLVGTILARASGNVRLVTPIGASSASMRINDVLDRPDSIVLVACSKQPLVNPPDPGGSVIRLRIEGSKQPDGMLVAIGGICVTECIATAAIAHEMFSLSIEIRAVAEVSIMRIHINHDAGLPSTLPVVSVSWCAPNFVASYLWRLIGRMHPIAGYRERWGATP